jgi:hypothetical protein
LADHELPVPPAARTPADSSGEDMGLSARGASIWSADDGG